MKWTWSTQSHEITQGMLWLSLYLARLQISGWCLTCQSRETSLMKCTNLSHSNPSQAQVNYRSSYGHLWSKRIHMIQWISVWNYLSPKFVIILVVTFTMFQLYPLRLNKGLNSIWFKIYRKLPTKKIFLEQLK